MAGDEEAIARGYELDQEAQSRMPSESIAHKTLHYVYIWFDGTKVAENAAELADFLNYIGKGDYDRLGVHLGIAETAALVAEDVRQ